MHPKQPTMPFCSLCPLVSLFFHLCLFVWLLILLNFQIKCKMHKNLDRAVVTDGLTFHHILQQILHLLPKFAIANANAINKLTKLDVIYTKKFCAFHLSLCLSLTLIKFSKWITRYIFLVGRTLSLLSTCDCCLVEMHSNLYYLHLQFTV